MGRFFLQRDKIDKFLNDPACESFIIPGERLREIYMDDHVSTKWGENEQVRPAKIISISMKRIEAFIELEDLKWVKKQKALHMDLKKGATGFTVSGSVKKAEPCEQVRDFYFVSIELEKSVSLCDALWSLLD